MKTPVLVFSRLDSSRLPGKALLPVGDRTLLQRVIDRAKLVKQADGVVLATSDRPLDDPLVDVAQEEKIAVFRGSTDNVASRALACLEHMNADRFVRISGDSPFLCPSLVDRMIETHMSAQDRDITTNIFPRGFPPGLSVEVIEKGAIERIVKRAREAAYHEHVTLYAYEHPDEFRIRNVGPDSILPSGIRLVVDTQSDLERAREIMKCLPEPQAAVVLDVVVAAAMSVAEAGAAKGTIFSEH